MASFSSVHTENQTASCNALCIGNTVEVASDEFRLAAFRATSVMLNTAAELDVQQASLYEQTRQLTCSQVPTWVHPDMSAFE